MSTEFNYRQFVQQPYMDDYLAWQDRHASQVRESDKVLMRMVAEAAATRGGGPVRLLDLGCSTGNLLRHLRHAFPQLELEGADLAPAALAACRSDAELAGIVFEELDILRLDLHESYDIIVVNAVLYCLLPADLPQALAGLAAALHPGGRLLVFDLFHPHPQDLIVQEVSTLHPDGALLHLRSYETIGSALAAAGFDDVSFAPFQIPIDLGLEGSEENRTVRQALASRTIRAESGERLLFRGALYQPWCHLGAVRAG